nr:MAG TPA: hypothetical protein [Bacteriophage sp.]
MEAIRPPGLLISITRRTVGKSASFTKKVKMRFFDLKNWKI